MPALNAYLSITDPVTGKCTEIVNGARTLSLMRQGRAADGWEIRECYWPGQDAWMFNENNYGDPTVNTDPWYDEQKPESQEVAGFLVDGPGDGRGFQLESPTSTRIMQATGRPPLEMYITGSVVAASKQGERHWLEWFDRTMLDCCVKCVGFRAEVFAHIPCPDDFEPYIPTGGGRPVLPPVDSGAPPEVEVCEPNPPVLERYSLPLPVQLDDGHRELLAVRYVGRDELPSSRAECAGRRWQLRFEVSHPAWYQRSVSLGDFSGGWDECDAMLEPFDICSTATTTETACGTTDTFRRRRTLTTNSRFVVPSCFIRKAFLTAPLPWTSTGRISGLIRNSGASTINNIRLQVWPAFEGRPSPATDQGRKDYAGIAPVVEALIPEMNPGDQIRLDGRTGEVELICITGDTKTGSGIVETSSGASWFPPSLQCDAQYWVALDLPAEGEAGSYDIDADISVSLESLPS